MRVVFSLAGFEQFSPILMVYFGSSSSTGVNSFSLQITLSNFMIFCFWAYYHDSVIIVKFCTTNHLFKHSFIAKLM